MGQSVSSVIRAVDGEPCHEKRREAEDVLNTVVTVAEEKARIHHSKVAKYPIDNEIFPVEKVLGRLHMIHCGLRNDLMSIKQVMKDCLRNRVRQDIIEALAPVTLRAIERLTDLTNGKKSSELSSYAVTIGKSGAVCRLDCYFFYYRFGSTTIASVAEDCLITSLVISSVDPSRLHANDIRGLVEPAYSVALPNEPREASTQRAKVVEQQLLNIISHPTQPRTKLEPLAPKSDVLLSITKGSTRRPIITVRTLPTGRV